MSLSQLRQLFEIYASFSIHPSPSTSSNLSRSRPSSIGAFQTASPSLDSSKFLKLCKDVRIIDGKRIKPNDVDLVFAKVLGRSHEGNFPAHGRKLNWDQFVEAIEKLSEMKFESGLSQETTIRGGIEKVEEELQKKSEENSEVEKEISPPAETSNTKPLVANNFQKMLDLICSSDRHAPSINHPSTPSRHTALHPSRNSLVPARSSSILSKSTPLPPTSHGNISSSARSVWDKLTDLSSYPHTHRERFYPDGTGKGIAGREDLQSPPLMDLSKVCDRSPADVRGVPLRHSSTRACCVYSTTFKFLIFYFSSYFP
jgi:hypothetical protein